MNPNTFLYECFRHHSTASCLVRLKRRNMRQGSLSSLPQQLDPPGPDIYSVPGRSSVHACPSVTSFQSLLCIGSYLKTTSHEYSLKYCKWRHQAQGGDGNCEITVAGSRLDVRFESRFHCLKMLFFRVNFLLPSSSLNPRKPSYLFMGRRANTPSRW